MRQIARELNIGLDSLIFIDDNPNERELMRQALPEVLTPELPTDPALYRSVLETLPQLQMLGVTQEDRKRVELYRSGKQREASRAQSTTLEDYLHSLDIQTVVAPASERTLPRIHQLFQRTNQFNTTTRRHELETLRTLAQGDEARLYGLSARDRFGDHGLVAVALVRLQQEHWRIDSFLMSCRVIGYGIETALLGLIARDAGRAGAAGLVGEFIPTAKNKPAEDIYRKHGFAPVGEDDGVALWELDLRAGGIALPAWVSITEEQA
jgi:FkbH-like protein